MQIGSHAIGQGDVFFDVEEGMANLGSLAKALSMIDAVAATGADAIEFQFLRAEDFSVRSESRYDLYKKLEFSDSQMVDIVQYARSKSLEFVATALTHTLVDTLTKAGCSAFNVNASDLTNPAILDAVAETGYPFFLSLLMASHEEIDWAVDRVIRAGAHDFGLLHGQHTMFTGSRGVPVCETALGYIETLKQQFHSTVGFIDHTPYPWMPGVAVAAGAEVVSKHLALSRADQGPDYQICLEPEEMKQAIDWARQVKRSMQSIDKVLAAGEEANVLIMRKSIVAARPLKKGQAIQKADLAFKRPGTGLSPSLADAMVGAVVAHDLEGDQQLTFADVEPG